MKNKSFLLHLSLIIIGTLFYFVANFQRIAVPGAVYDILSNIRITVETDILSLSPIEENEHIFSVSSNILLINLRVI